MKTGQRVMWICPAGTGVYGQPRPRGTVTAVSAKRAWVKWDVGLETVHERGDGKIRSVKQAAAKAAA